MIMELEYIDFLCNNLIGINSRFAEIYSSHIFFRLDEFDFYYDDELINFMVNSLKKGSNYEFLDYDKLDKLLDYIIGIKYLRNKYDSLMLQGDYINKALENKERIKISEISDYVLADSKLMKLEINQQKKVCRCFFHNALFYGSKKDKENYDVEADNIILNFREIKEVKLKGTFDMEFLKYNNVYSSNYYKVSDSIYCFELLCIANYEHFIIDITFNDVYVEKYDYDIYEQK
jgi:hypothetical protein